MSQILEHIGQLAKFDATKECKTCYFKASTQTEEPNPTKMKTVRAILPVPAPSFTTSRLLLRPMKISDLEDLYALRTQIEVMRWTTQTKNDENREATQIWMNRFLPPNDSTTYDFCAEELSSPGVVIGVLGMHIREPPECGYMFRKEAWGKGYATEAMRGWLQNYWSLPRKQVELKEDSESEKLDNVEVMKEVLQADVLSTNVQSQRVLEKLGFSVALTYEAEEHGKTITLLRYQTKRPD